MSTNCLFKVEASDGQTAARVSTWQMADGKALELPVLLMPTSRGLVPHLTCDHVNLLPFNAVEIGLETLLESDFFVKNDVDLDATLKFTKSIKICSMRNTSDASLLNGDSTVAFTTNCGVKKMEVSALVNIVNRLRPHVFVGPADVCSHEKSLKAQQKAHKKNNTFNRIVLEGIDAAIGAVFSLVLGLEASLLRAQLDYFALTKDSFAAVLLQPVKNSPISAFSLLDSVSCADLNLLRHKPLMIAGAYSPAEIVCFMRKGVDIFDSSYAAFMTESGYAITISFSCAKSRKINLWDTAYKFDTQPICSECSCIACSRQTRCYIHHLLNVNEMLAKVLLMHHNLMQMDAFMGDVRQAVKDGKFEEISNEFLKSNCPV